MSLFDAYESSPFSPDADEYGDMLDSGTIEEIVDNLTFTADGLAIGANFNNDPYWKLVAQVLYRTIDELQALQYSDPLHVH